MATDDLPAWQQQELRDMRDRLRAWLPDHKLHLVLIRAPFHDRNGREITDPAFEQLLITDPEAAQRQLHEEFEADRLAGIERAARRAAQRQADSQAVQLFVSQQHRSQPHPTQSIPLP